MLNLVNISKQLHEHVRRLHGINLMHILAKLLLTSDKMNIKRNFRIVWRYGRNSTLSTVSCIVETIETMIK